MPSFHKYSHLRKVVREAAEPNASTQEEVKQWDPSEYMKDPVKFAVDKLQFTPTEYQEKLLRDESKRIVVIYPRQSGKTTTLPIRMIWYAAEHPRTTSLIVAPGLRQSSEHEQNNAINSRGSDHRGQRPKRNWPRRIHVFHFHSTLSKKMIAFPP